MRGHIPQWTRYPVKLPSRECNLLLSKESPHRPTNGPHLDQVLDQVTEQKQGQWRKPRMESGWKQCLEYSGDVLAGHPGSGFAA
jgi:hypothetical protein